MSDTLVPAIDKGLKRNTDTALFRTSNAQQTAGGARRPNMLSRRSPHPRLLCTTTADLLYTVRQLDLDLSPHLETLVKSLHPYLSSGAKPQQRDISVDIISGKPDARRVRRGVATTPTA